VSLILDALRKLERERDPNRPPGVLVVGSVPWGETSRHRRVAIAAGIAAVLALAVLAGWMLRPALRAPAVASPSATPPGPLESRPAPAPLASSMPDLPNAAAASEQPPPPIRLSKPPSSAPMRGAQATSPTPSPTDGASEPAPGAESQPVPARERISVSPGVEGEAAPPAAPPGELRLNAISQRDGRPVALINDRLVFEGDSFDGVRVIRIGEAEVEVEVEGERRVLRF
jgi:hypothetical protein